MKPEPILIARRVIADCQAHAHFFIPGYDGAWNLIRA
jgi:hypothetical protein